MFTGINSMSLADAAMHYAAQGIPVFPLLPHEKKPLPGSHGCKDATTDAATVRDLWTKYPTANIGIATGPGAGFLVLDVDGEEGEQSLAHITEQYGDLPPTPRSRTGRGQHILFKDTGGYGNSASVIGPKLDVRAAGGYIVAPPSVHPNGGAYLWESDGEIAPLPHWFHALSSAGARIKKLSPQEAPLFERQVTEGGRNAMLASFAGVLRRKGVDGDALFDMLMTQNAAVCDPPLSEREVRGIARSISNYPTAEKRELTDHGNALRFVTLHGQSLRYVADGGFWLQWQGTHWQDVSRDMALQMAYDVPGAIHLEAAFEDDPKAMEAIRKHAKATQSRPRLEAIVELARPLLSVHVERLDADPMLLSVRNGQLDLSKGTLEPHNPDDFITKFIDIEYQPDAKRPRWDQFIREIMCEDDELARFLQRVGGYCLSGLTREQVLFIFHGNGGNGKSIFIEVLRSIIGPYASKTPMTTFLSLKGDKPSNDLARLRGTRFVSAVEVARGDRLNEPLIKELTGGDTVTARLLFREFFEYRPQFKIVMSVNDLPRIEAGDEAINRRLVVVPFRATFSAEACDQHLMDKLREETAGVLAWLVEGCVAWQCEGLDRPAIVKAATDTYISTNDALGEFLAENCIADEGYSIPTGELFRAYEKWLKETYGLEINKMALGRLMAKKGIASKSRSGQRHYVGVALKPRQV
jgi:putative DNA primase/helicase